jgi:hypothetical protein
MTGDKIPPCIFEIVHCVSMSKEMIQVLVGELLKVHPWRATACSGEEFGWIVRNIGC